MCSARKAFCTLVMQYRYCPCRCFIAPSTGEEALGVLGGVRYVQYSPVALLSVRVQFM